MDFLKLSFLSASLKHKYMVSTIRKPSKEGCPERLKLYIVHTDTRTNPHPYFLYIHINISVHTHVYADEHSLPSACYHPLEPATHPGRAAPAARETPTRNMEEISCRED